VKLSLCLTNYVIKHYAKKAYGGFITSALVEGEWSASRPGRFTSGERAVGTHWIGGWVGPRAGLDDIENWKFFSPPELELGPLGRPACSQSLYRLRYPGYYNSEVRLGKETKIQPSSQLRYVCLSIRPPVIVVGPKLHGWLWYGRRALNLALPLRFIRCCFL
jgi:hypothetical protein